MDNAMIIAAGIIIVLLVVIIIMLGIVLSKLGYLEYIVTMRSIDIRDIKIYAEATKKVGYMNYDKVSDIQKRLAKKKDKKKTPREI